MDLNKIKILVVDDNKFMANAICSAVRGVGIPNVFRAHDGYEAIKIASVEKLHLILLDLVMPGIDGFQTLKLLNSMEHSKDTHIVVITANDDIESVTKAIKLGAKNYVLKSDVADFIKNKLTTILPDIFHKEVFVEVVEQNIFNKTDYNYCKKVTAVGRMLFYDVVYKIKKWFKTKNIT